MTEISENVGIQVKWQTPTINLTKKLTVSEIFFVLLSSLNNTFLFVFKERELALKFFSTLSGVKTDKLDMVGQKLNQDHLVGNCELCDSGRIKEALEALARFV